MDNVMNLKRYLPIFLCVLTVMIFPTANAEVTISDAWVRATAPGQTVGAAYATLKSTQALKLVHVETERVAQVELHSMRVVNGVMKMRSLKEINLPENQAVRLAPGGLHLMLMGLKQPLKAGEQMTVNFHFLDAKGEMQALTATLPVKAPD